MAKSLLDVPLASHVSVGVRACVRAAAALRSDSSNARDCDIGSTPGFHGDTTHTRGRVPDKERRCGVAECASIS